jgi:hypothetical protein
MVVDEQQQLLRDKRLFQLLSHYVRGNEENREIWQNRVMDLSGARPEDVVRLHGRLLACEWIEQNTGGGLTACYRATTGGRRAFKNATQAQMATANLD